MKIVQVNIGKSEEGTNELRSWCAKQNIDVALTQEPYTRADGLPVTWPGARLICDRTARTRVRAAIYIFNRKIDVLALTNSMDRDLAACMIETEEGKILVTSIYCHNTKNATEEEQAEEIRERIEKYEELTQKYPEVDFVAGLDANAKSPMWYSNKTDTRGEEMEEALNFMQNSHVVNKPGNPNTYRGYNTNKESNIDITLTSENLINKIEWKVLKDGENMTLADHRTILMEIYDHEINNTPNITGRIRTEGTDWQRYRDELSMAWETRREIDETRDELEERAKRVTEVVITVSERVCGRVKFGKGRGVKWWGAELNNQKREVRKARREYEREPQGEEKRKKKERLERETRKFKQMIKKEKHESWRKFVTETGRANPWSIIYKMSANKMKTEMVLSALNTNNGEETETMEETLRKLCTKMFPADPQENDTEEHARLRDEA